ncbi:MAG: hypothetical protein IPG55_14475 [Saprospiraceae bacterium]|nr:hypothetical protein [Candidatus Defluviibacterium haderslevense]
MGSTWIAIDGGLIDSRIRSLAISNQNIYAGTESNGVWYRPIDEIITNTEALININEVFLLYPNPSTTNLFINNTNKKN